jgi:predicted transcriptional regulator
MIALQALVPRSGLDNAEALVIAEVQATVLLRMIQANQPPAPMDVLARHLDIITKYDPEAGEVGYHGFDDETWYIGYGDEAVPSRDATIAHQIKRIIDTPFGDGLYPPSEVMGTTLRKHYVAEYFAMCLTLPARWVDRAWRRGDHDARQLAKLFGVTPAAMLFRLKVMRLVKPGVEL